MLQINVKDGISVEAKRRPVVEGRTLQRQINAKAALRRMRHEPVAISEIIDELGVSRPAAGDIVAELVDEGWAVESAPDQSIVVGRPARSYRFNANQGSIVGVDIGAHTLRIQLCNLNGEPLAEREICLSPEQDRKSRLAITFNEIDGLLRGSNISPTQLWSIGVASPGVIRNGSVTFYGGPDMPGWVGTDLAAAFTQKYGPNVHVEGDSALGALGEVWQSNSPADEDLVYILAGYRVGLGIVLDGRLVRGYRGAAGLIGEMPELGWHRLDKYPSIKTMLDNDVSDGAEFNNYCSDLALGIQAIALALDPRIIVVGGGIGQGGEKIIHKLKQRLAGKLVTTPMLRASMLGDRGVLHGAVRLALMDIDQSLFDFNISIGRIS